MDEINALSGFFDSGYESLTGIGLFEGEDLVMRFNPELLYTVPCIYSNKIHVTFKLKHGACNFISTLRDTVPKGTKLNLIVEYSTFNKAKAIFKIKNIKEMDIPFINNEQFEVCFSFSNYEFTTQGIVEGEYVL